MRERPGDIRENTEQTGLDEKWLHCGGARNLASKVIHIFLSFLLLDPKALLRYGNEIMLRLIIQIARSKNERKEDSCSFKGEM